MYRRLSGPGVVGHGLVDDDRRRRVPAIDRRRVDEGLEERAHLPARLRRAIELAAIEAEAADHRADLAGAVVDGDERALDERRLLERRGLDACRPARSCRRARRSRSPTLNSAGGGAARPRDRLAAKLDGLIADPDSCARRRHGASPPPGTMSSSAMGCFQRSLR